MKDKLISLLNNAYAPYSRFKVAAVVVMKDGKEFYGVNVENASYGASICAERVAITSAIANGYKKNDFEELYVMCGDSKTISMPCMICRQMISEFFEKEKNIVCMDINGNTETHSVKELCPFPFDEGDLQ